MPIAKIPLHLPQPEMEEIEIFIKENTLEKFGPVRTLKHVFVFEIEVDGIELSKRHKSGVLVRGARVIRWSKELNVEEASQVNELLGMIL